MAKITVDGKVIEAVEGKSLLQTCLENNIYIPNLCFLKDMEDPTGACRLCFVEIEGRDKMVPSCKTKVVDGMVVTTDGPKVREAQTVIFKLLFSSHNMTCKDCLSKAHCELQKIGKTLGLRLKKSMSANGNGDADTSLRHPCFDLNTSKCILCRRCLYVCTQKNGKPVLSIVRNHNGKSSAGMACEYPPRVDCYKCRACVDVCPVNAIALPTLVSGV